MNLLGHLEQYKLVYTVAAAALALVGGTIAVELPADRKVAQLEAEFAQNWQQRQTWEQQQQQYHNRREIDDIQWRMRWISNEINRINQIPQYLGRPLTPQEQWQIDQLRQEWELLQERLFQLTG